MKIVIVGGTGLVATELIRQSLGMSEITSVVALARKPIQLEADAVNKSKFKSVVIRDYEEYPDTLKPDLSGTDAVIWWVAHPSIISNLNSPNLQRRVLRKQFLGQSRSHLSGTVNSTLPKSSVCVRTALWLD